MKPIPVYTHQVSCFIIIIIIPIHFSYAISYSKGHAYFIYHPAYNISTNYGRQQSQLLFLCLRWVALSLSLLYDTDRIFPCNLPSKILCVFHSSSTLWHLYQLQPEMIYKSYLSYHMSFRSMHAMLTMRLRWHLIITSPWHPENIHCFPIDSLCLTQNIDMWK